MLAGIKAMIAGKQAFQESASIIMEDANGSSDLDDLIVLGEESEPEEPETPEDETNNDDGDANGAETPELPNDGGAATDEDDDIMNSSIDELPTPVGMQTGEPINDDIDDLLKAEIDLKSNTLTDTLPIPPANAGEAIASDDILNQHIDSGFGGDDNPTALDGAESSLENGIANESAGSNQPKSGKVEMSPELKKVLAEAIKARAKSGDVKRIKLSEVEDFFGESGNNRKIKLSDRDKETLRNLVKSKTPITLDRLDDDGPFGANGKKPMKPMKILIIDESAIDDIMDEEVELTEAITLDGADPAPDASGTEGGDPAPTDDSTTPQDPGPETEENPVTAAVRDKVAEADTDMVGTPSSQKEELLKKLGNITKNLEDAKRAIMDSLQ